MSTGNPSPLWGAPHLPETYPNPATSRPPDISGDIVEYVDLVNNVRGLSCNCPQDLGYPDAAACDEGLGRIDLEERDCLSTVLEGYEEEGQAYLTCANATWSDHVQCLEANVNCVEGALDDCAKDHSDAVSACPQLPDGIRQSFVACDLE